MILPLTGRGYTPGPPVSDDAIARLVLAADPVVLIAAERENTVVVLAEIEEDVTGPSRTRSPPHGYNRAECRPWEPNEIRVVLETARYRRPRAAYTNRLETSVDEDSAPGIADASAVSLGDEVLDTAVLTPLLETETAGCLGQPWRSDLSRGRGGLRHRGPRGRSLRCSDQL